MRTSFLSLAAAMTLAAPLATPLAAQSVSAINGTVTSVNSVTDVITSAGMQGLRVTATLENGLTGFATWGTGGSLGSSWGVDIWTGANATGTHLARITMNPGNQDTYFGDWVVSLYQQANLTSFVFEGGAANGGVLFDRSGGYAINCPGLPLNDGTCGSNIGHDFDMPSEYPIIGNYWSGITAQYSNAVGLGGDAPVGDLFTRVTVNFTDAAYHSCFVVCSTDNDVPDVNNSFSFRMDTDRGAFATTVTPEPSTYALMATGLFAIFAASRRRRRTA